MNKNLKIIGKNYTWLKKQVEKFGIKPEEALVVTLDGKDKFSVKRKKQRGLKLCGKK